MGQICKPKDSGYKGVELDRITFVIRLADVPVGISALYPSTKEYCRAYLTEDAPALSIEISPEDIAFEREKSAREDVYEALPVRQYPDYYLETLAVYRKIVEAFLDYDVILFHGSVIAVDNAAYLFAAKSGTGKSTHTRLWRERFGERAVMVNDDKPLLKITRDGVTAYGTPWDGKHRLSNNIAVPLQAICILERSQKNQIRQVTPRDAWPMLMQQSYRSADPGKLAKSMELLDILASEVGLYRLGCNMEPEAAEVAYQGMQSLHYE
ncbi:hypothetical protein AALC25_10915 [Lachnospiraceae bacterium 29-84]